MPAKCQPKPAKQADQNRVLGHTRQAGGCKCFNYVIILRTFLDHCEPHSGNVAGPPISPNRLVFGGLHCDGQAWVPMIPLATEFQVKILLTLPQAPTLVDRVMLQRVSLGERRL